MADVRLTATNPEDSSVVPVACDSAGRLLLEEPVQGPPGPQGEQGPPGQDGQDGDPFSGNFAGDVTFDGSVAFGGDCVIEPGSLNAYQAANSSTATVFNGGWNTGGGRNITSSIHSDGSAHFSGRVETVDDDAAFHVGIDKDANKVPLNIYDTADGNKAIARINGDGSASFASGSATISSSGGFQITSSSTARTQLNGDGIYQMKIDGTVAGMILSDGSTKFAGNKAGFTSEGHLYCTTTRGETVMLDFTANGMGQWIPYTPTSRLEELRDKLDAIRGDTGEMPADTP